MTFFITDHDYLTSAAASVRTQEINTGSRFMIDDNLYESGGVESHCSTVQGRAPWPVQWPLSTCLRYNDLHVASLHMSYGYIIQSLMFKIVAV